MKFPYSCIHTNCNLKFKTQKEKLQHHYETDHNCVEDKEKLLNLLMQFKDNFVSLTTQINEEIKSTETEHTCIHESSEVKQLKRSYEKTLEELIDPQSFMDKIGKNYKE